IDREKVLAAAQKYVEKKKYDKAVVEYERIIQEDPNDARTLLKMGDLQLKMEGYGAAAATYERVHKFYAAQGVVPPRLQRQNRDQEAIEVFRRIVDLDATNPLPHLRLAEALSRAKDID